MKIRFMPAMVLALSAVMSIHARSETNATGSAAATNQPKTGVAYPWQQSPGSDVSPEPQQPAKSTELLSEPQTEPMTETTAPRRFIVGTRITQATLVTPHKKYFRGKLDTMDVDQDYSPDKVFAVWYFLPNWGLEVTWDHLRAAAFNEPDADHGESVSDGAFTLTSYIATLQWRYTELDRWMPFAGVGAASVKTGFDHAPWWHYGYNSPQHWIDAGRQEVPYKGDAITGMRTFDTKDTTALVASAGCDYRITDHWEAGIYGRYMPLDVETHWTNRGQDKGTTKVPLDNYVLGLSLAYGF